MTKIISTLLSSTSTSNNGNTMLKLLGLSLLALLGACTDPDPSGGGSGDNLDGDINIYPDEEDTDTTAPVLTCNDLEILPTSVQFGEVQIGETSSQAVTVYNNSDEGCDSLGLTVTITGSSAFTLDLSSVTVTPGSNGIVWATYSPTSLTTDSATFTLSSTDLSISAPLTGTGFDIERCDGVDNDGDGVIDNDTADQDNDGVCDGRDSCPDDSTNDVDGDGVCGADDICDGYDDTADTDSDGTPDGCDVCPLDAADDSDGDGNCDSVDVCPGEDDGMDFDGDGFWWCEGDCDDEDPSIYPGATETWYDGVDSDCSTGSDYDQDADGYDSNEYDQDADGIVDGDDCNDADATIYPDAADAEGDGIDSDCDDETDASGEECATEYVYVYVDAGSGACADGNGAIISTPGNSGTYLACEDRWYIACNASDASITAVVGTFTDDGCVEAYASNPSWVGGVCGWLSQ